MQADILNAFLRAASRCLSQETHGPVRRLGLNLEDSDLLSHEVNVYVAMVGQVRGMCLVSMSLETARRLVGQMMGEELKELNEIALSALAETGNLVSGLATVELSQLGLECDITPPTLMVGKRARVSALGLPRFVIPLATPVGDVFIQVAADVVTT
jgi:chemotaxis protein CheX